MAGPVPAYNNPTPIPGYFTPRARVISNIIQGVTTQTVTSLATSYVVGQTVRFLIPPFFGMPQINQLLAYVIEVISTTEFIVDIDSRLFSPFIATPVQNISTLPQIIAIGDTNLGNISTMGRFSPPDFPGAFKHISPKRIN